jgi:alpha-D-ribose 1-methylphosphonate 5-triphosphate diphosphatase PhnM
MSKTDELERTAAFRATVRFPSQARLAVGRERLLAAAMAGPIFDCLRLPADGIVRSNQVRCRLWESAVEGRRL